MIYLDNAATTFPKPEEVYEYVDWIQRNMAVNTGRGSYKVAREANEIIDKAKTQLAKLLHVDSSEKISFLSSATIASNVVIGGLELDQFKTVYVSPFEHNAIMRPLELFRKKYGFKVIVLPFIRDTQELDIDEMKRKFSKDKPDYVFVNHVSNVTGLILPIEDICLEAKKYDAITVIDGSQSIGLFDFDYGNSNYDFIVFAGHKNLYASFGIGGFINNSGKGLNNYITGGTGSDSLNLDVNKSEVGSPDIIAIASLLKAIEWIEKEGIDNIYMHKKDLINQLIEGLKKCNVETYLPKGSASHTSVVSFNVAGYEPHEIGVILDGDFDIAVRTGFHCAPLIHKLIGTELKKGTVRVSVGYFNTYEDIQKLIDALKEI